MISQTTSSLAGLGLFLSGLRLLASSLQPLAGRRMRVLLSKLTSGSVSTALAGTLLGAITQSSSAATFVCVGLLNSGTLKFQRAFSIIAWSSVGTSLLVFLAAIDMRLAGLYVVGMVGVAHLFNAGRAGRAQHMVSFMFALGVLFLGLGMIKDGSAGLGEAQWLKQYIDVISANLLVSFFFGAMITLVAQSSATVTILVVTLNLSGLMNFQDALFVILGASVGSGLSVALVTTHFTGKQRQLGVAQLLVKLLGVVLFFPVCWLAGGVIQNQLIPFDVKLSPATELAIMYLALQIMGALSSTFFQTSLITVLNRIVPLRKEDEFFSPQYIYSEAASDPDTAVMLARREQNRLIASLHEYLDPLRPQAGRQSAVIATSVRHATVSKLAEHIKSFIEDTGLHVHSEDSIARLFSLQNRNEQINSLQECLFNFVTTLESSSDLESTYVISLVESLHLVLTFLSDVLVEGSEDKDILIQLTSDKSGIMENMRTSLLSENSASLSQRQSLYISTSIFERSIWLVRQLVQAEDFDQFA